MYNVHVTAERILFPLRWLHRAIYTTSHIIIVCEYSKLVSYSFSHSFSQPINMRRTHITIHIYIYNTNVHLLRQLSKLFSAKQFKKLVNSIEQKQSFRKETRNTSR